MHKKPLLYWRGWNYHAVTIKIYLLLTLQPKIIWATLMRTCKSNFVLFCVCYVCVDIAISMAHILHALRRSFIIYIWIKCDIWLMPFPMLMSLLGLSILLIFIYFFNDSLRQYINCWSLSSLFLCLLPDHSFYKNLSYM